MTKKVGVFVCKDAHYGRRLAHAFLLMTPLLSSALCGCSGMARTTKSHPYPILTWSSPTENEDGTPLTDLTGFLVLRRLETERGPEPCGRDTDNWFDPYTRQRYCAIAHLGLGPSNANTFSDKELLPVLLRTYGIVAVDSVGNQSEPAYYDVSPSLDVVIVAPVYEKPSTRHIPIIQSFVQALAQRNEMRPHLRPHHAALILFSGNGLYPTEIQSTGLMGQSTPSLQPVTREDANAIRLLDKRALNSLPEPSLKLNGDLIRVVKLANGLLSHRPQDDPGPWGRRSVIVFVEPEHLPISISPSTGGTSESGPEPGPEAIVELAPDVRFYVLEATAPHPESSTFLLRRVADETEGAALTPSVDESPDSLSQRLYAHMSEW